MELVHPTAEKHALIQATSMTLKQLALCVHLNQTIITRNNDNGSVFLMLDQHMRITHAVSMCRHWIYQVFFLQIVSSRIPNPVLFRLRWIFRMGIRWLWAVSYRIWSFCRQHWLHSRCCISMYRCDGSAIQASALLDEFSQRTCHTERTHRWDKKNQ
jgi:hypothetical protein